MEIKIISKWKLIGFFAHREIIMFPVKKLLFWWKLLFTCKEIPPYNKEVFAGFGTQTSSDSQLIPNAGILKFLYWWY